ncbi:hypothetical protein PMI08_02230 [Brevibacillus sp. CF112]|nr:hypothetical protein PMI08_02230 [Brevibacillus sp. CF112]
MRFDTLMTIAVVLVLTSCYCYLWKWLRSKTSG